MSQYGCACNAHRASLYSVEMKQLSLTLAVLITIILVVRFDVVIIFMLSGFIPGINVTLAPSTMLAVMIASVALGFALRIRQVMYQHCLSFYDEFLGPSKKDTTPIKAKPARPRRRYQEL